MRHLDSDDPHSQDKDWAVIQEARTLAEQRSESEIFRMQKRRAKILLGNEQPEGFTAPTSFYLFWCHYCEHWAKDYPHGFESSQRLNCHFCGESHKLTSWRVSFWMTVGTLRFGVATLAHRWFGLNLIKNSTPEEYLNDEVKVSGICEKCERPFERLMMGCQLNEYIRHCQDCRPLPPSSN
ncbi:MAG: hypothetical protein Q8P76_04160 [bacterium]|nr:hypothetical protein [bacterium]